MAQAGLRGVVDRLRRGSRDLSSDGDLLDRFVADRDGAAFAELVARHGPKVFAVCLRVLGHYHPAEDAYQATFLVLARKAGSIRPSSAVGGFLYGVARKAALEAHAVSLRRRESLMESPPDSPTISGSKMEVDVLRLLDEEIANLTDPLRAAVVMCELDGVARAEAARQLGIAEGTLSSRLAAARKQLAARLKKRGAVFSAGLMTVLAESVATAVPPVPSNFAAAPAAAVTLANRVLRTMTLSKLKLVPLGLVLLTALSVSGIGPGKGRVVSAPPTKAAAPEGVLLVARVNTRPPDKICEVVDPAGKSHGYLDLGRLANVHRLRVSPDGKRLAFGSMLPVSLKGGFAVPEDVYVVDLPLAGPPTAAAMKGVIDPFLAWAPDGKSLYVSGVPKDANTILGMENKLIPRETVRYDVAAKTAKPVDLPEGHTVLDVSPDGKTLLTQTLVPAGPRRISTYLVSLDTLKPRAVGGADDGFSSARFSPDGSRILGTRVQSTKSTDPGLFVYDVTKDAAVKLPLSAAAIEGLNWGACAVWSPDGERVAVLWDGKVDGPGPVGAPPGRKATAGRITVLDATGRNEKTIREYQSGDLIRHIEWAMPNLGDKADREKK
jgi:RNA polymerase sigma factor (sigma-70 family)